MYTVTIFPRGHEWTGIPFTHPVIHPSKARIDSKGVLNITEENDSLAFYPLDALLCWVVESVPERT